MEPDAVADDLFELGRRCFDAFTLEFASYGIPVDPKMELRRGKGLLCFYDTEDGHIYLSVPDVSTPMGQLNLMVLRAYLSAKSQEETMRFFRLFVPRLISHEIAHHLRHRHGRFGDNLWEEEQLANQLAVAVTRHRMTPEERAFARDFLKRALFGLSKKVNVPDAASVSYYNVLEAMNASGEIGDSALEQMEVTQKLFSIEPALFVERSPELSQNREEVIAQINSEYATDYVKYMYFHAGWLYVDLTNHSAEYVEEFARAHLGVETPLLAPIESPSPPSDEDVHACFLASQVLREKPAASRYFYKRYRTLLWTRLQTAVLAVPSQRALLKQQTQFFVESWSEGDSDAMSYLSQIAPVALRELFPARISARVAPEGDLALLLPCDADRRLFLHASRGEIDPAAESTLYRLSLLDETDVFRPVPAESMLELCRSLCRIRLAPGETIIWEGEVNDDVFFLTSGRLSVLVMEGGCEQRVGTLRPGEVFGEMAFFSRDIRNATVRASEASECFVIKDSDLLILVFKHPSILMQMAGALTRRLANLNRHAAGGELPPHSLRR